jgi:TM2 domain-containing membrane protein YozV
LPQNGSAISDELLIAEYAIWNADDDNAVRLIISKSKILYNCGRFSEAMTELGRTDSMMISNASEIYYLKSLNTFLLGDYHDSYNWMLSMDYDLRVSDTTYLKLWLLILNENQLWKECKKLMLNVQDSSSLLYIEIKNLHDSVFFISPVKAARLSSFIPGAGQLYAGYPIKGITSFIFTGSSAALTTLCGISGFYASGIVYGLIPVLRFYFGGKNFSYQLACGHNDNEVDLLKQKYINCIRQLGISNNK